MQPALLWTIHNRRYDLSAFVNEHPGGRTALLLARGRNATSLFESYHSLCTTLPTQTLQKYFVRDVRPEENDFQGSDVYTWQDPVFYADLKQRARAFFAGKSHKASLEKWVHVLFGCLGTLYCLWGFFHLHWLPMLCLPFFYWIGPSSLMHDGSHFSLSRSPTINKGLAYLGSAHMSISMWNLQHTIGHHCDTNIASCDPDLYHFSFLAERGFPGFRTSPELRPMKGTRMWLAGLCLRIPFTTCGPSFGWNMHSVVDFEWSFLGLVPFASVISSWCGLVVHFIGRMVVASILFGYPMAASLLSLALTENERTAWTSNGWLLFAAAFLRGLAFALLPLAIHGMIFYTFSQVSHIQSCCFSHVRSRPSRTPEWAEHQVLATLDYATQSRLWLHLSNGLNHQIVHHLFPQVDWVHYPALSRIVRSVCLDHGVPYDDHVLPSIKDAMWAHWSHLCTVNGIKTFYPPPRRHASPQALAALGEPSRPASLV